MDAELEIVDRDPLVRGVDEPRGELAVHRLLREEAVRDGAERLAHPVRVGEAGADERREAGSRLELVDPALERRPERRLQRRARAAVALEPLELVVARPDRGTHERIDVLGRHARRQPAVDRHDAGRRDHVALLRRLDHRRGEREREQRLDELGRERMQGPRAIERHLERRQLAEHELEEPRHLGDDRLRRLVAAERLDDRRRLDERVVGDRRHRRVAAAPAHVDAERGAHLLADGAEVEDVAAEDTPLARRPR